MKAAAPGFKVAEVSYLVSEYWWFVCLFVCVGGGVCACVYVCVWVGGGGRNAYCNSHLACE